MKAVVCTLFENDYHYGLGALVNSLHTSGYRGNIWAGHRGELPPWAIPLQEIDGRLIFHVSENCSIQFIPFPGERHLTNCKPDFMLRVLDQFEPAARGIFYFDPDIIIRFPWRFFEGWISDSVALCEDINSPMPNNHPKRKEWRRLFQGQGIPFQNHSDIYLNGGFIGLPRVYARFLLLWQTVLNAMAQEGVALSEIAFSDNYQFWSVDQDALNIATMATDCAMSFAGKDGMGFILCNGPMLHAVGSPKPWKLRIINHFLAGRGFAQVQREYWNHVESPIRIVSPLNARSRRMMIKMAAFACRFYSRR